MANGKGRDIGMGSWSDAAIRRQMQLHKAGEPSQTDDPKVARPPERAKCEGHFVWTLRQAAFIGRDDGTLRGGLRHYVTCTSQAKRYDSVAQARAAAEAIPGDVLIMYGYGPNWPLYIVGK